MISNLDYQSVFQGICGSLYIFFANDECDEDPKTKILSHRQAVKIANRTSLAVLVAHPVESYAEKISPMCEVTRLRKRSSHKRTDVVEAAHLAGVG